jgi:hypothetical protein
MLRDGPPPLVPMTWTCPSNKSVVGGLRRMNGGDVAIAATFLEAHYSGSTWKFQGVRDWLRAYLADPNVLALGVFRGSFDGSGVFVAAGGEAATLMGTVFGIPLCTDGSSIVVSGGNSVRGVITVEGTCIHPDFRGQGLMNFLLAQIDAFAYLHYGTSVALWCREMSASPIFTTALRVDTYSFRGCGAPTTGVLAARSLDWDDFCGLWEANCISWVSLEPSIVVPRVSCRRGGLQAFQVRCATTTTAFPHVARLVVVVGNTARIERRTGAPLYEVMWCGFIDIKGHLMPSFAALNFQQVLNAIAGCLPRSAYLYANDSLNGGGAKADWDGWIFGRAGVHAWFLYNYIPPLFGGTRIHMLRDEF